MFIDYSFTASRLRDYVPAPLPEHSENQRYRHLCFGPRPAEELYDCQRDPWQMTNLAALPEHQAVRADLAARLDAHLKATGDPRATGRVDALEKAAATVEEQQRQATAPPPRRTP